MTFEELDRSAKEEDRPRDLAEDLRPRERPHGTPFGQAGQFVVTTGFSVGLSSASWDRSSASRFAVFVEPALEYFVIPDVSIGIEADFLWRDTKGYGADGSLVETKYLLVGGGPHIGVNLPMGRRISLYSRLMLGLHHVEQDEQLVSGRSLSIAASPTGSASVSRLGPWLELEAPLLVRVAHHFFVGAGPWLYHDFSRAQGRPDVGAERTSAGATMIFGGFWGGPEVAESEPIMTRAEPSPPSAARFGQAGSLVLTEETAVSIGWVWYSGVDSSANSLTLSPGADLFVGDHVSLGLAFSYSYDQTRGLAAPDQTVLATTRTLGAIFRAGGDLPLNDWLSLYPRVSLGVGKRTTDEMQTGATLPVSVNTESVDFTWVGISAPLLVHVAPHFFIGLGPRVSHDVTASYDRITYENRNTTLSLGSLIGGWI